MTAQTLSAAAAREAVHLLILQEFAKVDRGEAVVLKGGVNLRLFFGSVRYSEDMDLDGDPHQREAIRGCIKRVLGDGTLVRGLQKIGIRGLDPGEGPNKDTETTFRYKFGVIMRGDIRYPTKVEVSFRDRYPGDQNVIEVPDSRFFQAYGLEPGPVCRYRRNAAVRQKIDALGGRREAQARDVFDLGVLVRGNLDDTLLTFIAAGLGRDRLEEARDRTFTITFDEYEGRVLEFLDEGERLLYGTKDRWHNFQLETAELIESAMARQEAR
jgi:Nucleotidyl transferase AbiEii toxin, Type IV TA system